MIRFRPCLVLLLAAPALAAPPVPSSPASPSAVPAPAGRPAVPAASVPAPRPAPGGDRQQTFISPMGEPFRADAGGVAPDLRWFAAADRDHDGRVTLLEMRADAYRFFKTLDLNHDGEIDPEELQHYEQVVAPEINVAEYAGSDRRLGPDSVATSDNGPMDAFGDLPQVNIPHRRDRGRLVRGAGRLSYFDLPEPVAAADADMNRGVSAREFDAAAAKRFLLLDQAHDGYLSYAKLQALRQR